MKAYDDSERARKGFSISEAMLDNLDQLSDDLGVDRSTVLRLLLRDYFYLLEHNMKREQRFSPNERIEQWINYYNNPVLKRPRCQISKPRDTETEKVGMGRKRSKRDPYE